MKLDLSELKRIEGRCRNINTDLSTQLTSMSDLLESICENVQSSELSEANKNLVASINSIYEKLKTNVPKVTDFLNTQIAEYEKTNEQTQADINSVANVINDNVL